MAICIHTPSLFPISSIPKRKILGGACNSTSSSSSNTSLQNWNISEDILEAQVKKRHPNFSEEFWVGYKDKMEEIKRVLLLQQYSNSNMDQEESLILVDAIQRVGLAHHFHEEIDIILRQHHLGLTNHHHHDLYYVSLHFRLLRNRGYPVSSDVLKKFKGNEGEFKVKLRQDVKGLMELHEAAQLGFLDEDIIDEAEEFSRVNLNKWLKDMNVDDNHKRMIKNTLRHPQHKSIPRLMARNYMHVGLGKEWRKTLIELAKMDAMTGQLLHKEELLQISKWWRSVGIAEELPRARSQPVKWYIWSMATLINSPSLSVERVELTKAFVFVYLIDDIFDLYGTIDELAIFTQAINRWEYSASDALPEYMRNIYKALLDTINDIAQKVENMYGTNPINYFKAEWGRLCSSFMVEARWLRSSDLPRAKEYLENGKVSTGAHIVQVHLFFLLGLGKNRSSIHLNDTSSLVASVATIVRLYDDLGSAKDEHQDGSDGSYIKCCMNDQLRLSVEEVREQVENMISKQWKILNKECFVGMSHSSVWCFREAALNSTRMVPLMYTYDENQRLVMLEDLIKTAKLLD